MAVRLGYRSNVANSAGSWPRTIVPGGQDRPGVKRTELPAASDELNGCFSAKTKRSSIESEKWKSGPSRALVFVHEFRQVRCRRSLHLC